jgi:FimV-like protein
MTGRAAVRAGVLACAMALAWVAATHGWAQTPAGRTVKAKSAAKAKAAPTPPAGARAKDAPPTAHQVRKGDTLFAVARKNRHLRVSVNQMMVAIFRANPGAFDQEDANQLRAGSNLSIPDRDTVAALDPEEAARVVQSWHPKPKPPVALPEVLPPREPVPTVMVPPPAPPRTVPPPKPRLSREDAEKRYREGLAYERAGNEQAALAAFLEAGEAGHGKAQKRLGEIYDSGNTIVTRDYQAALRWYQKAREQGVEIPKPFQFPGGR